MNTIFGSGWWSLHARGSRTFPLLFLLLLPRPESPALAAFAHSLCGCRRVTKAKDSGLWRSPPSLWNAANSVTTLTRTLSEIGPLGNFLHSFARTHPHQRILVGAFMFHEQDPGNSCEVWCKKFHQSRKGASTFRRSIRFVQCCISRS